MSDYQTLGQRAQQGSDIDQQLEDDSSSSWLMTYGDLISVLLTFFVMLQGISIVNEDEFAELFNRENFFVFSKEEFKKLKVVAKEKVAIEQEDFAALTFLKQAQSRIQQRVKERERKNRDKQNRKKG
jgi:flagellar motor protein MotB